MKTIRNYYNAINYANKTVLGLTNAQILISILILTAFIINVAFYGLPKY